MERSVSILKLNGRMGMIVPVSIVRTDGFSDLRQYLQIANNISWNMSFAERPSKLFTGVEKRLTIWIMCKGKYTNNSYLSHYRRWFADERDSLFSRICFVGQEVGCNLVGTAIPKIQNKTELKILSRLAAQSPISCFFNKNTHHVVYYTRKLRYFIQILRFYPFDY